MLEKNLLHQKIKKKELTNTQLTKALNETIPLTITDYYNGLNDVNNFIEKYSKIDKNDVIDKKTAKELNLKLMHYGTELPNFRANTKIETLINKLNDYKILIDGQIISANATGFINQSSITTKEPKESLIPKLKNK